jgi:hypothetical protein
MLKKEELKNIIYLTISIASIFSIGYLYFLNLKLNGTNLFRSISFGITITTSFWVFYFSKGWKWPLIKNIFYRPDVNGTWKGIIESDYILNGEKIEPIEFYIVIRQSFIRIHFTTFTQNFVGMSYAETFTLNKDKGLKNLAYMYRKDSSQKNDDLLREGATELRLILSENEKKLEGKYWSNTKTQGIISVKHISKIHVDSFKNAQNLIYNG